MAKMKVAQVSQAGGPLEIVERDIPAPRPGQVRVKVEACGLCHSDSFTQLGYWPGIQFPRAPGHEVAGVIDALGEGVTTWKVGQRVGVGWHGGHCTVCGPCRRGQFSTCVQLQIPGISFDGGYAEYMVTPAQGLAAIPEGLKAEEAGPILCAGVTTFNALRHSGALPGDVVAIQGLGGLGHFGIQFANKMGFETVAIGRGADKRELITKLGAHHYIDTTVEKPAEALQKLGGAKTILATAPSGKSMTELVGGLGVDGTLVVVGASPEAIEVSPAAVIGKRSGVRGWPSGTSADSEDALRLCALSGVRPMIEIFPLSEVNSAYQRMMSGKARFRVVLKIA